MTEIINKESVNAEKKVEKESDSEKTNCEHVRQKDYDVPPISRLEFVIYLIIWIYVVVIGVYEIYRLTNNIKTQKQFLEMGYIEKGSFGLYKSNNEYLWNELMDLFTSGAAPFTLYIIISKCLRSYTSPKIFMFGNLLITLYFNYYYSSAKFLGIEILVFFTSAIAGLFRHKSLIWIIGCLSLYSMVYIPEYSFFNDHYIFKHSFPYLTLLFTRAISIGLTICKAQKYDVKLMLEMAFYYWYFPAIIGCRMMVIKDFINNIYKPCVIEDWKKWWFSSVRMVAYIFLWNIVMHYCHIYLTVNTNDWQYTHISITSGVEMFYGIHYYMVYLILYKSSFLVAQFDGFLTAEGPECIAHIALYSRMWRNFDIALHIWLKDHVFRPIAKLGPFKITRYFAAITCFLFVVNFHGLRKDNIFWISFSIIQYCAEHSLKYIFLFTWVGRFLEKTLSPIWLRRLIAVPVAASFCSSVWAFAIFQFGFSIANDMYFTKFNKSLSWMVERFITGVAFIYAHAQISLTVNEHLRKRKLKTS